MKKHYRHENDCLNCGVELQGKFCHVCGQENLEMKESFGHMLNHAISDYFHFDYQFFHTLKPLLFKPGKLTTEYLLGRRMQYLHPVKMYIFISLVYFVLILKSNTEVVKLTNDNAPAQTEIDSAVKKALIKNPHLSAQQKKQIEADVKKAVPAVTFSPGVKRVDNDGFIKFDNADGIGKDTSITQYNAEQQKLPAAKRDGFIRRFYMERSLAYVEKYGKNARDEFFEQVKHNLPKMMFVLLPLFALILQVAFSKNDKYYVEHLIYAIHLHCNYFLVSATLLVIGMLLPASWIAVTDTLGFLKFIYTIWYIYRSLKLIYERSRWRTISKMAGISVMYFCCYMVCMMGLLLITAAAV